MKFFTVAVALLSVISATAATSPAQIRDLEAAQALTLDARSDDVAFEGSSALACTPTPKCKCNKVQGQFCGLGNTGGGIYCKVGDVFECNKSTGNTCTYGVRKSCQQCNKLKC